jgi:uncharacterized iron-regulated protein
MIRKIICSAMVTAVVAGCAALPEERPRKDAVSALAPNTIISGETGTPVSFDDMMADLVEVRIVYVGENHTDPEHHRIQKKIIGTLHERGVNLSVGLEMVDFTYQAVLDRWAGAETDREAFLEITHWYANWRYDIDLYWDIFAFAKERKIRLVALNTPFHLPPRVRIGGLANLTDDDRRYLPSEIVTSNLAYKNQLAPIFKHHNFGDRGNFDYFFEAQCLWDETMAESIVRNLGTGAMAVLVGNGHIVYRYGVPDRAYRRAALPYRTVYLTPVGSEFEAAYADYIWLTAPPK